MSFPLLIAVISETENNLSGSPNGEKPWQKSLFVHRHPARPAGLFSRPDQSLTLRWTNIILWNNPIRASACWKSRGAKEKTEGCNYYFHFKILEGPQSKVSERWWGHLIRGRPLSSNKQAPDEDTCFEEGIAMPDTQISKDLVRWCYLYWVNVKRWQKVIFGIASHLNRNLFEVHSKPDYVISISTIPKALLGRSSGNCKPWLTQNAHLSDTSNPADLVWIYLESQPPNVGGIYCISKRKREAFCCLCSFTTTPLWNFPLIKMPHSTEEQSGLAG